MNSPENLYTLNNDFTEIVLHSPTPKRRMDNMLYNKSYMTYLNHFAKGNGKHMKEEFSCSLVNDNRVVYVRDDESGEYFSVNWYPVFHEYQKYSCTAGLNYTVIKNMTDDLDCVWRIYVPAGEDPVEIWDFRIVNRSGRERKLSIFTFMDFHLEGVDLYCGALYRYSKYLPEINSVYGVMDGERHLEIDFPLHNGFFTSNREPDSWDANSEKFVGEYDTLEHPKSVREGKCGGTTASMWIPAGCYHYKLNMAPDAREDFRFVMGGCDKPETIKKMRERYLGGSLDEDSVFDQLQVERRKVLANVTLNTPEKDLDCTMNHWAKHQIHYGATWVRWGYKGYRDIVQQSLGVLYWDSGLSRENLLKACAHQYADGFALRGWHPTDPMRYADSAQWMVAAFAEYAKETGDMKVFDEELPFFDEGKATVYEHLTRAIDRLWEDRGERGLNLVFFGDWNDSLTGVCREGKGESVWLSMAFCRSCLILAEIAEELGLSEDAAEFRHRQSEMAAAINKNAWDGDWYLCAIDDYGKPIGSKENDEGKIFLNMQSWALLGKVADEERWDKAWTAVKKHLDSGYGLTLNWPVYTKPVKNVGRLSYLRPGIAENASVYTHGNAFMLVALLENGKADEALELWRAIAPASDCRPVKNQPNVFVNCYSGPDCEILPGAAEHTWVTGSASWMVYGTIELMIGLRRGFSGMTIKPCLPSAWDRVEITRTYRGTTYEVEILNPGKKPAAKVASISINGASHPVDEVLPLDGKTHQVKVTLEG